MATFKEQVDGITGISTGASTTPNHDELSQFLVDGTADVINRCIEISPEEISKFTTTTNSTTTVVKKGRILAVYREHDSTSILRPATNIPPELKYEATDPDSLYFRSKFNPGYYEKDGNIECVPEPNDASNNDLVVTQVNYAVNTGHSSSSIDNFPDEKEYLVVIYAAIKVLEAKMADYIINEEDSELVAAIQPLIVDLKNQYDSAFTIMGTKQARQQQAMQAAE